MLVCELSEEEKEEEKKGEEGEGKERRTKEVTMRPRCVCVSRVTQTLSCPQLDNIDTHTHLHAHRDIDTHFTKHK